MEKHDHLRKLRAVRIKSLSLNRVSRARAQDKEKNRDRCVIPPAKRVLRSGASCGRSSASRRSEHAPRSTFGVSIGPDAAGSKRHSSKTGKARRSQLRLDHPKTSYHNDNFQVCKAHTYTRQEKKERKKKQGTRDFSRSAGA